MLFEKAFLIIKRNAEEEKITVSWILFGEDMIVETTAAILFLNQVNNEQ